MKQIKTILLLAILFLNPIINYSQNLVVGFFDTYEQILLNDTTVEYDTVYVLNNAKLTVTNSQFTCNTMFVVTDSAQVNISGGKLIINNFCMFYGNSQTIIKDTLVLNCDLNTGNNASLTIDSAFVNASMTYIGQYELIGFDNGVLNISNSSFELGQGKFGGGFRNNSSFNQINTTYNSSLGISMTIGFVNQSALYTDSCNGGFEIIISDTTDINFKNSNFAIIWLSFADNDTANFSFPIHNSPYPYASDVTSFNFSDTLAAVSGIDYNVNIEESETIFWGVLQGQASDVNISNSELIAYGLIFNGNSTDTLNNFYNDSTYISYNLGMSDRKLNLTNTVVKAWNFYPMDSSNITIDSSIFGEILSFDNAQAKVINSTCDGTGGYFGANGTSKITAINSTILREGTSPAIILTTDLSTITIEESNIIGDITLIGESKLFLNNTTHNKQAICNDTSYFLEVFLDTLNNIFTDSVVNITGTINEKKGILNTDNISSYKLELSDSINFHLLVDTVYSSPILQSHIYTWSTTSLSAQDYTLWLSVYVNNDSIIAAKRNIVLKNPDNITNLSKLVSSSKCYPNPFSDYTIIKTNKEYTQIKLIVYNCDGNKIYDRNYRNTSQIIFKDFNLNKGLYIYQLISEEKTVGKGKFIIQ